MDPVASNDSPKGRPTPETVQRLRQRKAKKRRQSLGMFLKGPIPDIWLNRLLTLSRSAIAVGLSLYGAAGLRGTLSGIRYGARERDRYQIAPRTARRGLRSLVEAGLVSVDSKRGRCPVVTILDITESAK